MKKRVVVLKNKKKILTFSNKTPKGSIKGETDSYINTGRKLYFNNVVAGNYFRHYSDEDYNINSISWHGYFLPKEHRILSSPRIHIKDEGEIFVELPHIGCITKEEPIAYPIFSLWFPEKMDLEHMGKSGLNKEKNYYIHINDNYATRIDFFMTPKEIPAKKVLNTEFAIFIIFADIGTFNTGYMETTKIFELKILENLMGHDIIIRKTYNASKMFCDLKGTYSLILHDPNDPYNRLLARPLIKQTDDKGNKFKRTTFKDEFEMQMGIDVKSKDNFLSELREKLRNN